MRRSLIAYLWITLFSSCLSAQLDLLTLREAQSLVELIPDVVAAERSGECPNLSPTFDSTETVSFQVRRNCGPNGGTLISNYSVNRATGEVTLWGDDPKPVADDQGKMLAARLVREARKRILSPEEAQCLALTAATGLPGWNSADAVVSVKPFGQVNRHEDTMRFTATRSSTSRPVDSGRMLTVYLTEARIRDDETGMDAMSAAVGDLSSKLLNLRAPVWISDEEAASVALSSRPVATSLADGCRLNVGGAFYSHQALLAVSCKGQTVRESNVLVDLETGAVTDPETRKSLDTADTQRIAGELLSNAQKRRAELKEVVETVCRAR